METFRSPGTCTQRNGGADDVTISGGDDAVRLLIPAQNAETLSQSEIGIDLADGWTGDLALNGVPIDDVQRVDALNQLSTAPTASTRANCVTATIWRSSESPESGRAVEWCFGGHLDLLIPQGCRTAALRPPGSSPVSSGVTNPACRAGMPSPRPWSAEGARRLAHHHGGGLLGHAARRLAAPRHDGLLGARRGWKPPSVPVTTTVSPARVCGTLGAWTPGSSPPRLRQALDEGPVLRRRRSRGRFWR